MNELTTAEPEAPGPDDTAALVPVTPDLFPERLEMNDLASMAVTLAFADLVPKALRGKPNDVFMVLLTARDLGVRVTTALREFHVIDGKLTLSPKVRLAMVNEQGADRGWRIWKGECSTESATWHAVKDGKETSVTVTWADAVAAGLTGKDNWKHYPQRMLSWRACGWLLDDVFPEVGTGLYSPDELGAVTDEDGRPVNVIDVEPVNDQMKGGDPVLPEGERGALLDRIQAIAEVNDAAKAEMFTLWKTWGLPKVEALRESGRQTAYALVGKVESYVKAGKYAEQPPGDEDPSGDAATTTAPPEGETEAAIAAPDGGEAAEEQPDGGDGGSGEVPPQPPSGCEHPFETWEQVGRCVYCTTCSERIYQGTMPKTEEEGRAVLAMLEAARTAS